MTRIIACDEKGSTIFEQDGVEFPKTWSMLATNVVASKYFYGELGTDRDDLAKAARVEAKNALADQ